MRELPPCTNCGKRVSRYESHGWCRTCRGRWERGGRPEDGVVPPPRPPVSPGPADAATRAKISAAIHARYAERLVEFRKLDRLRIPVTGQYNVPGQITDREIAERLGVTRRTIWRYRAAERAAGRGWWKDGRSRDGELRRRQ